MIGKSGNRVFNEAFAREYGMAQAVVFNYIYSWCVKNYRDGNNCHDGAYWTYDSYVNISERLGYLTPAQVKKCILDLEKEGLIESGNYNKNHYDKTKWYTISEYGFEVLEECSLEPVINMNKKIHQNGKLNGFKNPLRRILKSNRADSDSKPIPITKPITKTNHSLSSQSSDLLTQGDFYQEQLSKEESVKYCLESDNSYLDQNKTKESEEVNYISVDNKNSAAADFPMEIDEVLIQKANDFFNSLTPTDVSNLDIDYVKSKPESHWDRCKKTVQTTYPDCYSNNQNMVRLIDLVGDKYKTNIGRQKK